METDIDNREIARKNLCIVFLHSGPEKMPAPDSAWRERDGLSNCTRHKPLWRANPKALVNAAKFALARFRIAGPMRRLNRIDNRLILKRKFTTGFFATIACAQLRPIIADEEICRHPTLFLISPKPKRRARRGFDGYPTQQRRRPRTCGRAVVCRLNLTHCGDTKLSMWRDYLCKIVNFESGNSI